MIIINLVDLVKFMLEHWSNYISVLVLIAMVWFLLITTISVLLDKLIQGVIGVVIVFKKDQNDQEWTFLKNFKKTVDGWVGGWYSIFTMKAKVQEYIKNQLATNPAWAVKALVKVYTLQTFDEQASDRTSHDNGVGFSGVDANILSSFAKQVNAGRNLSQKQMTIVYKKMPRYWKQIVSFIPAEKLKEIEEKAAVGAWHFRKSW